MEINKEPKKWLTLLMNGIILNPILITYVSLLIWRSDNSKPKKIFFIASLVFFLSIADLMWDRLGYLEFIHWNIFYSFARYIIVIVLVFFLMSWLNKKVIKI